MCIKRIKRLRVEVVKVNGHSQDAAFALQDVDRVRFVVFGVMAEKGRQRVEEVVEMVSGIEVDLIGGQHRSIVDECVMPVALAKLTTHRPDSRIIG